MVDRHAEPAPDELRRLGLDAIVPDDVPTKAANVLRGLQEGRIVVVQAVAEKPVR